MRFWELVHDHFDPDQVGEARWRVDRPRSPVDRIARLLDLDLARGVPRVLLTGTTGTGKSTELLRLVEARADHEFVIYLDLVEHFTQVVGDANALRNVASWEVVFLVGLALLRAGRERLGFEWPKEQVRELEQTWKALAKATGVKEPPRLDIGQLVHSMVLVASAAAGPAAGVGVEVLRGVGDATSALRWDLPFGLTDKPIADQAMEAKRLLAAVNALLGDIQQRHCAVLLVIDGLDRVADIDHADRLFIQSDMLGQLDARLLVCGPFALRHHPRLRNVRRFTPLTLVNEPVLDEAHPADPTRIGPGVDFLVDVYAARVRNLDGADGRLPPELLRRLARASGGRVRDFIKLVRNVALQCLLDGLDVATTAAVEAVVDEERRNLEIGLHAGHIALLEAVMEDPRHRLPEGDLVWELLYTLRLLPYPDGSEWYYPQPLLTENLLRPAGSNASR